MREILFRGKDVSTKEWVYGFYVVMDSPVQINDTKNPFIYTGKLTYHFSKEEYFPSIAVRHYVISETIGQYTGLKDKNGQKIFEGDILKDITTGEIFEIIYEGHQFIRKNKYRFYFFTLDSNEYEVIGNIFDNLKLLN